MQIILQKHADCAIKACVFVWVGGAMAGLSAIGMGGKGQTKTSKATGNVALEGIRMKTFHWTNKCGCAALAHYAVPQQVSFTIRDFAEVHIRGSYKA